MEVRETKKGGFGRPELSELCTALAPGRLKACSEATPRCRSDARSKLNSARPDFPVTDHPAGQGGRLGLVTELDTIKLRRYLDCTPDAGN